MEGDQQLTPDADMGMSASDQSSSPSDEPHGAASLTGSTPEHNSQVPLYSEEGSSIKDCSSPECQSDSSDVGSDGMVPKEERTGFDENSAVQESVINSTEMRKLGYRPMKDKICLVCGDKALGYNFNAVSCESCKAFFRRNAAKTIKGRCEGNCEVTVESRSYCKRCRLQKCFTVGMKRNLILNDRQKQQRKQKIQTNRMRRLGMTVPSTSQEDCPSPLDGASIKQEVIDPCAKVYKQEVKPTATHMFVTEVDTAGLELLGPELRLKLEEVLTAFRVSFDVPIQKQVLENPSNADFLNMADMSVRRLVKMGKNISMFRNLQQEDQVALLKGSVLEVLILRSLKMFDQHSMEWTVQRNGVPRTVSAAALQYGNKESVIFMEQYQRFASNVMMAVHGDHMVLMLLIVLSIFSPDRVNLKDKEAVSAAQEEYVTLLREYITLHYPKEELMFAKVLQKLADIRELDELHCKMLLHMSVEQLEPLIIEIFDLSS